MSKPLLALICCVSAFGYAAPTSSQVLHEVLRRSADPRVSADGSIVVGAAVGNAFRWTLSPSRVTSETLPIPDAPLVLVHGTNGDGSVIVGFINRHGFRWTAAGGTQSLGARFGHALDVSSDGIVVVGESDGEAFRWTETHGLQGLGFLPGGTRSRANAIAGDAEVIVGFSLPSAQAFRWTPDAGMQSLGSLPGREGPGLARGVSSSGDVVVGQFGYEAFRWTADDNMVGLGFLSEDRANSLAQDVSSDGNRIVGYSLIDNGELDAFLWTPDGGMRSLEVVLEVDEGLDLAGLDLRDATGISDDGKVIVGWGRRGSTVVTWIADLNEFPPDAFQCYDLETSRDSVRFEAREVALSDQFGDTVQIVKKGKRLCAPVELDRAGAFDPEAHLLCYDLVHRRGHGDHQGPEPIEVRVDNRFGDDQHLTVTRPKQLCVPSTVERVESGAAPGDAWDLELDHLLCYAVRAGLRDFEPIEVSLADRFQTSKRLLTKPTLLCNPVDKNGEGILDPATHLTCYEVTPLEGDPRLQGVNQDVLVSNQFDAEQRFTLKKPAIVCVPSQKELVDDGPAACSAIEPGEFGLCRLIIGWGIDPGTGQCAAISGCGCDERCEGRIFPDELTCQQECGGR
ncbi:MAG: hypothetical protein IH974_08955 [Myxococcales bacterium]|nr:hypothetical protein [Myxococcales bacterium]